MTEDLNFPRRANQGVGDEFLRLIANTTSIDVPGGYFSTSITLVVSGSVLTGMLLSRDQWYKEWLAEIKAAGVGGQVLSGGIEKVVAEMGMHVFDYEFPQKDRPSVLHLNKAVIHTGGKNIGPLLMRVRVDSVSAWSLGVPENQL